MGCGCKSVCRCNTKVLFFGGVPSGTGLQGPAGIGFQGLSGFQGLQGLQGPAGLQGLTGFQGLTGLQGLQGDPGIQGPAGLQGLTGFQGLPGFQGLSGLQGIAGLQGAIGLQGFQGDIGLQGLVGLQGFQGLTGLQGFQGVGGLQGLAGLQGTVGLQGFQGIAGEGLVTGVLQYATGIPSPFTLAVSLSALGVITVSTLDLIGMGSNFVAASVTVGSPVTLDLNTLVLPDFAWTAPRALTLTAINGTLANITITLALLVTSATVSVEAFLETGIGSNVFTATGLAATAVFGTSIGLGAVPLTPGAGAVAVAAGQRVLLVAYISSTTGIPTDLLDVVTLVAGGVSAGISYV